MRNPRLLLIIAGGVLSLGFLVVRPESAAPEPRAPKPLGYEERPPSHFLVFDSKPEEVQRASELVFQTTRQALYSSQWIQRSQEQLSYDGQSWPLTVHRMGNNDGSGAVSTTFLLAIPLSPERTRVWTCTASGEGEARPERCRELLLEALARLERTPLPRMLMRRWDTWDKPAPDGG